MLALRAGDIRPAYKNQVDFDQHKNHVNFDDHAKTEWYATRIQKKSQFRLPPQKPS